MVVALVAGTIALPSDQAQATTVMVFPPAGFTGYLSFIANGEYDPTLPNPDVPGCFQGLCDGDYFQSELMGRTPADVDAMEMIARDYFIARFGVDPMDPANVGKLFFRRYYRDPRIDLRAHVASGMVIPRRGFEVHDGGCSITFLVDYPLGGESAGAIAPAGSSIAWGEYYIELSRPHRRHRRKRALVIGYRSRLITESTSAGITAFQNELVWGRADSGAPWGSGLVHATIVEPTLGAAPGTIRVNERHVLTFSPNGGL